MWHLDWTRGQRVAILGRAGYLATTASGREIDAADVVVRVNWTLPMDTRLYRGCGTRTDVLYTTTATGDQERIEAARAHGVPSVVQSTNAARKLLCKLAGGDWSAYTPTTGVVAIFDALESGASEVRVYGMDLYRSPAYVDSGQEIRARAVYDEERAAGKQTHNLDLDARLLRRLLDDSIRFVPDAVLKAVLR